MDGVVFADSRPADYLQRVASSEAGRAYKAQALAALAIAVRHTVVDLGCGPGSDLRDFAAATGPDGVVIGIDRDVEAVAAARRSLADVSPVHVRAGDVHAVDLPDASADRVRTDRVLQHVADPGAVVREARRLLRVDGRAIFAEPDYDTLVIDYPDRQVMRAYRSFVTDRVIRNAAIGRQLPGLVRRAGFTAVTVLPITSVFTDAARADEILGLKRVTERAVADGWLDPASAADWLDHLSAGSFFAALTLFVVVADV